MCERGREREERGGEREGAGKGEGEGNCVLALENNLWLTKEGEY